LWFSRFSTGLQISGNETGEREAGTN